LIVFGTLGALMDLVPLLVVVELKPETELFRFKMPMEEMHVEPLLMKQVLVIHKFVQCLVLGVHGVLGDLVLSLVVGEQKLQPEILLKKLLVELPLVIHLMEVLRQHAILKVVQ